MNITRRLCLAPALVLLMSNLPLTAAEGAGFDTLLPLPKDVRQIIDQRCVMCHGEVIDGKAEIREDLNLSTDDAIRETLSEPGRMKEVLAKDEMPHKAKLSFRLRKKPEMKERLESIKADFDKNGEKAVLMAWLKDVVATETPEDEKDKE
jgi:hypothetical protein